MPLNFPSSPTNEQVYTANGVNYVFLSSKNGWIITGTNNTLPYIPPTTISGAKAEFLEGSDNGNQRVRIKAPDSLTANIDVNLPGASGDIISTGETKTLTKGYTANSYFAGTFTSGTYTPDPANGSMQRAFNNGAHTLAKPTLTSSDSVSMVIQYTNNASAGAITTSSYSKVDGSFTTTNGDDFLCYITVVNGFSYLNIVALQ